MKQPHNSNPSPGDPFTDLFAQIIHSSNPGELANILCTSLAQLPGVEKVSITFDQSTDEVSTELANLSDLARWFDNGNETPPSGERLTFSLSGGDGAYGRLCLQCCDPEALAPHQVALSMAARVLGSALENHLTAHQLAQTTAQLDQIKKSEQQLQGLIDDLPVGVYQTTLNGQMLRVNRACLRMAACPDEKQEDWLAQDTRSSYVDPEDGQKFRQILQEQGFVNGFEARFRSCDGRIVWLSNTARLTADEHGDLTVISGTFENITERKQTEEALRAREYFLDQMIEQSPFAMWISDRNGVIQRVNPALQKFLGLTPEEIVGKYNVFEGSFARQQGLKPLIQSVYQEGKTIHFTCDWDQRDFPTIPDRSAVTVDATMFPIFDQQGTIANVGLIWIDITDRNQSRLELVQASRLLDSVREAQSLYIEQGDPQPVFDSLLDTLVTLTNSEFGFLDEVRHDPDGTPYKVSLALSNISWDEDSKKLYKQLRAHNLEFRNLNNLAGIPATYNQPVIANDAPHDPRAGGLPHGHPLITTFMGLPVCAGSEVLGVIGVANRPDGYDQALANFLEPYLNACAVIIQSIRQRTREEQIVDALRDSETRNRAIIAAIPDMLFRISYEGYFLDVQTANPEDLLLPPDQVIGRKVEEILPDPIAQLTYDRMAVVKTTGEPQVYRYELEITPQLNFYESRMVPSGENEVLAIVRDITELVQIEQERQEMERQVQHTQKLESLGVLAGGIAHDFNNLLMTILGNADLALHILPSAAPARENLEEVIAASRRAADLCKQMLAYSGKGKFIIEDFDLVDLVQDTTQLLKTLISKKARIELLGENNLPPIRGDASQIRQVVMNLVINASEAMGEESGSITIKTGLTQCEAEDFRHAYSDGNPVEGVYVSLEIADTGCGMDHATLERLFDPFFTTKFTGRGLGMSAVLGIVRSHKGILKVDSEPGEGTTFRVLLPPSPNAQVVLPDSPLPEQTDVIPTQSLSGRVLLVDDEASVRSIGQMMLEHLGFEVLTAGDGREAVQVYSASPDEIDLILLDLTMPEMDGSETLQELKKINPAVRVVIASGYSDSEIERRFAGQGLVGVFQKPYSMAEMKKRLYPLMKG